MRIGAGTTGMRAGGRGDARSGMTDKNNSPHSSALQELEAALDRHRRAQAGETAAPTDALRRFRLWQRFRLQVPWSRLAIDWRRPLVRRIAIAFAATIVVVGLAGGALWWRLSSGPIILDLATPWLTAAVEENLGGQYRIKVGGTQLERDSHGRTRIRLRDIVVRNSSGALVAIAPKAEVGLSGTSLLIARPRAESLRLVDANIVLRVEADGRVNVFAGGDLPLASIAPIGTQHPPATPPNFSLQSVAERSAATNIVALLAWFDGLSGMGRAGFDGHDLTEIGVTNGSLTIDDRRNGQEWKFQEISLRLIRSEGGVAVAVGSESETRPWLLSAALAPGRQGNRLLQVNARKVLLDDLLALRMGDGRLRSDALVSGTIQAEIASDGTPQTLAGTILAEGGSVGDADDPHSRLPIGNAEFGLDWDIARGTLRVPFKVVSGRTRFTLRSEFAAPKDPGGNWQFAVGGGWILLDPLTPDEEGIVLKRVLVRGHVDPTKQRVALEQADFGTKELGGSTDVRDISIALSGNLDYGAEQRISVGLAGNRMTVGALKRLWPTFVAPAVREWVAQHLISGMVQRMDLAANIPLASLHATGPAYPDDALSVDIVTSASALRPVEGLPIIRDADLTARITGRTATVILGKGIVDVSPGRRLSIPNAVFEVPDTTQPTPQARVRMRLEGSVPAAAELLALERLREFSGAPFDPATTRGTLNAQITLAMPLRSDLPRGATTYNMTVDLANFAADRLVMGQKLEAQTLRATANNQGSLIRGDVRINGMPAQIEYRKVAAEPDAELKLSTTLDETSRGKLGFDLGLAVTGSLPVKLVGRVGPGDKESRFNVEVDLTPVKIDQLLPGWVKPAGRPARTTFTLIRDKAVNRFDDLLIDGQGVLAKGVVEVDANGELQSANFPIFATSDGDKATLKADRGPDGALRVVMRGDVFDGRNFVKSSMAGPSDPKAKPRQADVDLDIKIGVVAGHHGEALRSLDLRMSRRGGRIRTFVLNAKIGRDTPLIGEMRARVSTNRQILYFETGDAGALFRFTDVYPRMAGGKMWVAMDPPTQEMTPQEGLISVRDFAIRGEGALDRVVAGQNTRNQIEFSQARAEFTKFPGRMAVRDGVVRGPLIGATIEGNIDYARDEVNMRGTLVPLYGINNMFGQIPIVGLFLGGGKDEGLLGITYEVTGPPSNPRPQVNPLSAIAPGLLRKFFEFRDNSGNERAFTDPSR